MSDRKPLMPKATAVWLVDNTSLTFEQIAEFCGLHVLEVKGIADGDVAQGIKGLDPVTSNQLTRDEIARAEADQGYQLSLAKPKVVVPETITKRGPRYTPVSRRHDRPNAVLWLLKNHPELKMSQIMRLVGTTKPTITQIKDRTHWNSPNLVAQDPVTLGLCTQVELDAEVQKASRRVDKDAAAQPVAEGATELAGTLLPTEETTATEQSAEASSGAVEGELGAEILSAERSESREQTDAEEEARVFAKLKELSSGDGDEGAEGDE